MKNLLNNPTVLIYFIFTLLFLVTIIFGWFTLLILGNFKKSSYSVSVFLNNMLAKNKKLNFDIKTNKNYFFTKFKNNNLYISQKKINSKSMYNILKISTILQNIERKKTNNKSSKYQLMAIKILFILNMLLFLTIVLLIILLPLNDNYTNGYSPGINIFFDGISIFGWMLMIIIFVWWINIMNERIIELNNLVKDSLLKSDYYSFTKLTKIINYIPFGSIYIK